MRSRLVRFPESADRFIKILKHRFLQKKRPLIFCYLETLICLSMLVNNFCYFRSFFLLYHCCLISFENVLRSEKDLCYANNTLLDNLSFIGTVSLHNSFKNSYLALFLKNAYFIGDNFSPLVWNSCVDSV